MKGAEDPEITYFVTYNCPHCHAELEARSGGWQGWLRCPSCKRPSLAPELMTGQRGPRRRVPISNDQDDVLVITALAQGPAAPHRLVPAGSSSSPARLIFSTGLIVSLFLLLIFFLDENTINMAIFGFLALVFFVLLLRTPGGRGRSQPDEAAL
jgi:hypothetical protein